MLDRVSHRSILLQILKEIYTDATLGPILGFKGGTAAFLFYELGRFSVDLDFDLLESTQGETVYKKIEKILPQYGKVKEQFDKKNTIFFLLSYAEKAQNIKVEINKRPFGSRYELKNYLGVPMLVMVKEDMFAHKLVALLERRTWANRDLFDVWFFLKHRWPIHTEIVEKRTGKSLKQYLKQCIEAIGAMSETHIISGIGELIESSQKDWFKKHLKEETIFLLKLKYASL